VTTREETKVICREAADDLAELRRLRGEIEALAAPLDEAAFLCRPAEGHWSVGECIGHLNATLQTYLATLPNAVARAREAGLAGEGRVRRGWFSRIFLWALEPPAKMRVKAPQAFLPRPGVSMDETMREFRELRDRLAESMESAADLDWARARMSLPTAPSLELRLGEIFAVLLAHERRHLWQIKNVLGVR
jgi:hypothetical protein